MFRHTLAQGILETTGNIKVAQEILGHAHPSTTADQYMSVDETAMVNALVDVKDRLATPTDITVSEATSHQATQTGPSSSRQSRYAFDYDANTIEELEAICSAHKVGKGGKQNESV